MEQKELNERYEQYKLRIEARKAAGETDLKLQNKNKWIRVVEIDDNENPGKTKKVSLPGISGETGAERGTRVAEARMTKLIDAADRLAQATGPSYTYTPAQVDSIVTAIRATSESLITKFEAKKNASVEEKVEKKVFKF